MRAVVLLLALLLAACSDAHDRPDAAVTRDATTNAADAGDPADALTNAPDALAEDAHADADAQEPDAQEPADAHDPADATAEEDAGTPEPTCPAVFSPGPNPPFTTTERLSVSSFGVEADRSSGSLDVSADGRYVAFASFATNLVPGDTNNEQDVFVRDRLLGTTTRVSVGADCTEGQGASYFPAISADGRFVAFASTAANLVANDSNAARDVFVHDLLTRETTRASIASDGSEANDLSFSPDISGDGNIVAFGSYATNLVAGDTTGAPDQDLFVHDRAALTTTRVNLAPNGDEAPGNTDVAVLSADGRYLAFGSAASNLVADDTNDQPDVFLFDRLLGSTELVSLGDDGVRGNATSFISHNSVTPDGRFVLFRSIATSFSSAAPFGHESLFVRDRLLELTTLVSQAQDGSAADNGTSSPPSISSDGRYVSFASYATNLLPGDVAGAEGFVRDLQTNTLQRLIFGPGTFLLSADGESVVFETELSTVVPRDTNADWDIFATPNPL